jgi:hypothetical protein
MSCLCSRDAAKMHRHSFKIANGPSRIHEKSRLAQRRKPRPFSGAPQLHD